MHSFSSDRVAIPTSVSINISKTRQQSRLDTTGKIHKSREEQLRFSNKLKLTYAISGGCMNLDKILSEIDLEISRLQQAKQLLSEDSGAPAKVKRGPGRPPASSTLLKTASVTPRRRTMSAAGRARIAAAQKARWAKAKKAAKKSAAVSSKAVPAKKAVVKQPKPAKAAAKKAAITKPEITPAAS